jgi:protease-4
VEGVVLRFTDLTIGLAAVQELRQAVDDLRAHGKKTTALLETDSQAAYIIASACEEIVMPPSGYLMLHGVKADSYFLKGLLAKLGVRAEVIHIGQYKAAGEMFTEDSFTTPARANMNEMVDDLFDQMTTMVAQSRKMTQEQAVAAINHGPMSPDEATSMGLIDRVAYAEEVYETKEDDGAKIVQMDDYDNANESKSSDLSPFSLLLGLASPSSMTASSGADSKYPQVAVVYATGPIVGGTAEGMLGGDEQIAAEDFIETLEEIRADDKIRAVILRVSSPGGSAFASDLIWRKMEELKKAKPVVVSMGDVAASGGYYIAMGANRVVAQAGTLTGSIGVVGGKADLAGLYEKVGVKKETISRGDYAGLLSETGGFSPKEHDAIERMMRQTYDEFVAKAAAGRNMTPEQMNELAQGKVWTGQRAKDVGLVDALGGMGLAVDETKNLLGMKSDDKVGLVSYPKEVGLMDMLRKAIGKDATMAMNPLTGGASVAALLPEGLASALTTARSAAALLNKERVIMMMPFLPVIR